MSGQAIKYPGLNLGPAHGKDDEAAGTVMFGFWVFLMSDAILFGLVFATYVTSLHGTAGGPGPHDLYDIKSVFIQTMLLLASSFTFGMAASGWSVWSARSHATGWIRKPSWASCVWRCSGIFWTSSGLRSFQWST